MELPQINLSSSEEITEIEPILEDNVKITVIPEAILEIQDIYQTDIQNLGEK